MEMSEQAEMSKPRIGVTCSPLRGQAYYGPYLRAVEAAGGNPVVVESRSDGLEPDEATAVMRGVDGLLLPGGWDVDPSAYGETPLEPTDEVDHGLDRTEITLVRSAVGAGLPVFGICRGQQLINVALGGSLHQHIDGHDLHGQPRDALAHPVEAEPDSELGQAIGSTGVRVNSLHHQSIKDVATGLHAVAHSPDGTVESVESDDRMVVAVQCHPEELVGQHGWALSLLQRFIDRAR